jgi:hypothetical protein
MDLENPDKTFRIDSHLLWEIIKMKIRVTAVSCSSYKKKENDKNEKLNPFLHIYSFCSEDKKFMVVFSILIHTIFQVF